MITVAAGAIALASIAITVPPARPQTPRQCVAGEAVTQFGEWFSPNVTLDGQTRVVSKLVPQLAKPAVGVRLQVSAASPAGQSWSLILRDPQARVLAILTEQDFGDDRPDAQWTGRLESAQISVELVGGGPGLRLSFPSGLALPQSSAGQNVFSAQGATPNWKNVYERLELTYRKAAEAVGMMVTGAQTLDPQGIARKSSWCCSGAMLTPTIYITNWHCGGQTGMPDANYWDAQVCANTILDLGWHEGPTARRQYACVKVLRQSEALDYTLLRVRPIIGPGGATGRAPPVSIAATPPAANDPVFMVHHAQCKRKLVSFSGCSIGRTGYPGWTQAPDAATGPDLTHNCDSEPGASGAPVFDAAGRMIALHHLGFQRAGPQCTGDRMNKAVSLASIYQDVQVADAQLHAELTAQ